jgi:hypothetical protein
MGSPTRLKKWVQDAQRDGWTREEATGPFTGKKPKGSAGAGWPKEYFFLTKDGYKAKLWFGPNAECTILSIRGPNGNNQESYYLQQDDGYNFKKIVEACNQCPHCHQEKPNLASYGLSKICKECIEDIEKHSQSLPKQPERTIIGKAKVELRRVHGRNAKDKVKEYRILANTDRTYWEPYNGTNQLVAQEIFSAVQTTLTCAGFDVSWSIVHTTWNGEEIKTTKKS